MKLPKSLYVLSFIPIERGGIVSEYDLDKKTLDDSLFIEKNLNEMVKVGTGLELKHTNMFEYLNASVLEKDQNTLRLVAKELVQETFFFPGDCVAINYSDTDELFAISGEITNINSLNPLDLIVKTTCIEKIKDLRKYERYYVSLKADMDVPGFSDKLFVVVKNMSSGGIKINCSEYVSLDEVVKVEIILDRINKLFFKGAIIRRSRVNGYYEYGIEIREISESNYKCLKHYLNWLETDYKNV